jgi:hypothetical protein
LGILIALLLTAAPAPLQMEVFVPLCDSQLIACGAGRAGDPLSLDGNLYWGAAYGAERYLSRAPGFRVISRREHPSPERPYLLRELTLVRAGSAGEREVRLTFHAYAGTAIDQALADFFRATAGESEADLVVWMGHDRLMDVAAPSLSPSGRARPAIVLACVSERYFAPLLRQIGSRPIALTRSLMAPEAYLLEAAAGAIARRGLDEKAVREALVAAYARFQRISPKAAGSVFSKL